MRRFRIGLTALAIAAPGCAAPAATVPTLTPERIVLIMRHGVRPPTKNPPMPAGIAAEPWPGWDVPPGDLTTHGAKAITLLGAFDRRVLAAGLMPAKGCPKPGTVSVYADSDQRTIATGDAWLAGFAPGCGLANTHKPQDTPDPIFSPFGSGQVAYDPARALAEVKAHLGAGGLAAVEARQHDALARLDAIYCGPAPAGPCGVTRHASTLDPARPGKKPGFSGALDLGSTAGQILLLEYADGKPMSQVGWGRARKADIALVGRLHAVEYSVLARTPYVSASNSALFAPKMLAALTRAHGPAVTILVGHDTQLAALGGLLDLHWHNPGFAADDPSPGQALGFELLRDAQGRRFVRAISRAQGLDQIRDLAPLSAATPATVQTLPIKKCGDAEMQRACPLDRFRAIVAKALDRSAD